MVDDAGTRSPLRYGVVRGAGSLQTWEGRCLEVLDASGLAVRVADGSQHEAPDLDFVLCFGGGDPPLASANGARVGAWRFFFGEPPRYGDGPPLFWEVFDGAAVAGVRLERVDPGGQRFLLKQGFVSITGLTLARARERVRAEVARWPTDACRALLAGAPDRPTVEVQAPASLRVPTPFDSVALVFKIAWRSLWGTIKLFSTERWSIGVVDAPIQSFLSDATLLRVAWLPEPLDATYFADPFAVYADGRRWLFAEQYDIKRRQGRISALALDGPPIDRGPQPAICANGHLSYPFVFSRDGEIYCIPESLDENEVALYRAIEIPQRWEKHAVLLTGNWVDATPLEHGGRFWLFCTEFAGLRHHRLHAFYADALAGPYHPHALNPIKIDPRSSGGAGTPFVHGGTLFRPSQDCSRAYGGSITINRVLELTPTSFAEEPAATVLPRKDGPFPDGIHTLSALGDRTYVDGKRREFTLKRVLWRLRKLFK